MRQRPPPLTPEQERLLEKQGMVAQNLDGSTFPLSRFGVQVKLARTPKPKVKVDAELLTGPQAAGLLNISLGSFYKLWQTRGLPAPLLFCRFPRWQRRNLQAWIDAGMPKDSVTFPLEKHTVNAGKSKRVKGCLFRKG